MVTLLNSSTSFPMASTQVAQTIYDILLAMLLICGRLVAFYITPIARAALTNLYPWSIENSPVAVSVANASAGLLIHLNGDQHEEHWKDSLWTLCAVFSPTRIFGPSSPLKVCIVVKLDPALSALRSLSEVLVHLDRYSQSQGRAANPLDLHIHIIQDPFNPVAPNILQSSRLRFGSLVALRALTWSGPGSDLFFVAKEPGGTISRVFPRLTALSLSQCVLSTDAIADMFTACPILSRCDIDKMMDATPTGHSDPSIGRMSHQHLKRLYINSSVGLRDFFKFFHLPSLDELSLCLSKSATMEPHTIEGLDIPWRTLRKLEVSAPMSYPDLVNLELFLDIEPSVYGRSHIIGDWSSSCCRVLKGFKARTLM